MFLKVDSKDVILNRLEELGKSSHVKVYCARVMSTTIHSIKEFLGHLHEISMLVSHIYHAVTPDAKH